jgi:hypothetical protein
MRLATAAFGAACAWSSAATMMASPVHVSVRWADPASTPPFHGQVVARPVAYTGENRPERAVECDRGEGSVDLPPGLWTFEASVNGFWAAPQELLVSAEAGAAAEIILRLWRAATLKGTTGRAARAPEVLLEFKPARDSASALEPGRALCTVSGPAFRCRVPAARLDVELRSPGLVPHYLWDLALLPERELDVGRIEWRAGASVSGYVRTSGNVPAIGAQVDIAAADGDPIPSPQHKPGPAFAATTDRRGFFQIAGPPPGTQLVVARQEGLATDSAAVRIAANRETKLGAPLVLGPPAALEVLVNPPADPGGKPWRLQLRSRRPAGSGSVQVVQAWTPIPLNGRWRRDAIRPGPYLLSIGIETEQEVWFSGPIEVPPDSREPVAVDIPVQRVHGTVQRGHKPLRARVVFGGSFGATHISFETDADGRFSGVLPGAADKPHPWPVSVEGLDVPVRRNFEAVPLETDPASGEAEVNLQLPNTTLEGSLVTPGGQPFTQPAIVTVQHERDEDMVQTEVGPEAGGHFRLEGLPPGAYRLSAEAERDRSDEVALQLVEGSQPARAVIVLTSDRVFKGQLLSFEGDPIAGARIKACPLQTPLLAVPILRSDAEGAFEVHAPAGTSQIALNIGALGFAYTVTSTTVPAEGPFKVYLERSGGRLRVRLPGGPPDTRAPFLLHGGFHEGVEYLAGWAALNGSAPREPGHIELPQMAAGVYALCLVLPELIPRLLAAGTLPRESCVSGTLPAGGELTLDLKAPAHEGDPR